MSFKSGSQIFEEVLREIKEDESLTDVQKALVLSWVIDALENNDWDCVDEFNDEPLVTKALVLLERQWEDDDSD